MAPVIDHSPGAGTGIRLSRERLDYQSVSDSASAAAAHTL